ncbi:MAG: zf-HC2 domain-containing protein [Actinomycetota bacterium]|nr:zf-HC2 domain-containing protein [Actinomycetota bacterium]
MEDGEEGWGSKQAEELVLRTIAKHADSLLRTARRHSLCFDDAQDAYQRGLEIFMRHAHRLNAGRAAAWLHTVVKREAMSIRRTRQRLVPSHDIDLDTHEATDVPTPEERVLTFEMVSRSAEALQRLKPQELRALWLKAQGHSYGDIGEITGWTYTKVNRCLTEGRQSFLARYAGIESGEECRLWAPVLSAMVDGEATPEQILELGPHLRNCPACRATLKALQDSSAPLAAVFPLPLVALTSDGGDFVTNLLLRTYEALAGGVHERAVASATKAQALIEASAAGKVAAVAASAAAVAGGSYATVERTVLPPRGRDAAEAVKHTRSHIAGAVSARPAPATVTSRISRRLSGPTASTSSPAATPVRGTHRRLAVSASNVKRPHPAPEFPVGEASQGSRMPDNAPAKSASATPAHTSPDPASSPEFTTKPAAPEFGP